MEKFKLKNCKGNRLQLFSNKKTQDGLKALIILIVVMIDRLRRSTQHTQATSLS